MVEPLHEAGEGALGRGGVPTWSSAITASCQGRMRVPMRSQAGRGRGSSRLVSSACPRDAGSAKSTPSARKRYGAAPAWPSISRREPSVAFGRHRERRPAVEQQFDAADRGRVEAEAGAALGEFGAEAVGVAAIEGTRAVLVFLGPEPSVGLPRPPSAPPSDDLAKLRCDRAAVPRPLFESSSSYPSSGFVSMKSCIVRPSSRIFSAVCRCLPAAAPCRSCVRPNGGGAALPRQGTNDHGLATTAAAPRPPGADRPRSRFLRR